MPYIQDTELLTIFKDYLAGNEEATKKWSELLSSKLLSPSQYQLVISFLDHDLGTDPFPDYPLANGYFARAYFHTIPEGGRVNYAAAIPFYEKAILLGHRGACHNLGLIYLDGTGCPVNLEAAASLFDVGAARGYLKSISSRAQMHLLGLGGPVDEKAACLLYDRAIQLGDVDAMLKRAWFYCRDSSAGAKDINKAIKLYIQSYSLLTKADTKKEVLESIKRMALDILHPHPEGIQFLILLRLTGDEVCSIDVKEANEYLNLNQKKTLPLLYQTLLDMIDEFAEQKIDKIQALLDFILEHLTKAQVEYIRLKLSINIKENTAFYYYEFHPYLKLRLNEQDFLKLERLNATRHDFFTGQNNKENKSNRLMESCKLLYAAYKRGFNDSCRLLINLLNQRRDILANQSLSFKLSNKEEVDKQLADFEEELKKETTAEQINELQKFEDFEKSCFDSSNESVITRLFTDSTNQHLRNYQLAKKILGGLKSGETPERIFERYDILNELIKCPELNKLVNKLFPDQTFKKDLRLLRIYLENHTRRLPNGDHQTLLQGKLNTLNNNFENFTVDSLDFFLLGLKNLVPEHQASELSALFQLDPPRETLGMNDLKKYFGF